jgi:hypothetical protein
MATGWRTLSFCPDPAGWRAVYLVFEETTATLVVPVAGWLVQEEVNFHPRTCENLPRGAQPEVPDTRVIAAVVDDAVAEPVTESSNFWMLLRPGQAAPRRDDALAEIQRRERRDEERRKPSVND